MKTNAMTGRSQMDTMSEKVLFRIMCEGLVEMGEGTTFSEIEDYLGDGCLEVIVGGIF